MPMKLSLLALAALAVSVAALSAGAVAGQGSARAQAFGPPMTVFGSITDAQGEVPEGLTIEAFVGSRICGTGVTEYTGEPPGRVTVYFVHVVSNDQTAGCGTSGETVRIKVGDRFAPQTTNWEPGPRQMNIVFGDASPVPIPTFTPTPSGTASGGETQTPPTPTPGPPGSPSPGLSATPSEGASPSPSATVAPTATPTATPTLAGGLATRPPDSSSGSDDESSGDEGFPVWGMVLIGVGALVAAGGGIGFAMARARRGVGPDADGGDAPDQ